MLKAAQNNLREQSSSYDLRREVEGGAKDEPPRRPAEGDAAGMGTGQRPRQSRTDADSGRSEEQWILRSRAVILKTGAWASFS